MIVSASASPAVLWPPNHKLVDVTVTAHVSDGCGAATWKIKAVASSDPADGKPDWIITGDHTLQLRAERSGNHARTYTITLQAKDASGNLSQTKNVLVIVPKSQGGNNGHDNGDKGPKQND